MKRSCPEEASNDNPEGNLWQSHEQHCFILRRPPKFGGRKRTGGCPHFPSNSKPEYLTKRCNKKRPSELESKKKKEKRDRE